MLLVLNDFLHSTSVLTKAALGGDTAVLVPSVVLSAFTLELCLKCLLAFRQTAFSRRSGHNLKKLFERLPPADQERIKAIHREQSKEHGWREAEADSYFDEALAVSQDDFTVVRYIYERAGGHETRNLGGLVVAVYAYIFEVRPDWAKYRLDVGRTN